MCTLRSIFSIFLTGIVEADKAKLTKFVFLENQGLYVAELGKHFPDVLFGHGDGNVLDINVVYELSDVSSFSWLELDWNRVRMQGRFVNSFGSRVFVIETHKSITSARMVVVERNLQTLDLAIFFEFLLKILMPEFFGYISNEHILLHQFLLISTQELSIKLQSSTRLAVDLEISHLFTRLMELEVVLDVYDCGIKLPRDILSNLRSVLQNHFRL